MNQRSHTSHTSATDDFLTYGTNGLELSRAMERRETERGHARIDAAPQATRRPSLVRRWLGDAMIGLGARIAGPSAAGSNPVSVRLFLGK